MFCPLPCLFSPLRLSISLPPVLISPLSLPCSQPALLYSLWSSILLSPLSLCHSYNPLSSVMCPQDLRSLWFLLLFAISCSSLFKEVSGIEVPLRRFSHVHLDLVGSLPSSQGFSYLLTMIDKTSRWPEAVPQSSITSESCTQAFISSWVSRFRVPALLTSDRGAQFTSSVWSEVCFILEISRIKTTSFHPQSNGMIDHFIVLSNLLSEQD